MSTQVHVGRSPTLATTSYCSPCSPSQWGSNQTNATSLARIDSTFSDLYVRRAIAPGTGTSATYTLLVGGVASAVTITIADTATEAVSTGSAEVHDGDEIVLRQTTSGVVVASEVFVSIRSVGAEGDESQYAAACTGSIGGGAATVYNGVFSPHKVWSSTQHLSVNVVSAPGTLDGSALRLSVAPGAGRTYTLVVWKNGVRQDGGGGTPDTRLLVTDAATSGSADWALPLVASDYVEAELTWSGTVPFSFPMITFRFSATTAGQSQYAGFERTSTVPSATRYQVPAEGQVGSSWSTDEAARQYDSATSFYLSHFRARVLAPTAVDTGTWALSLRRANDSPTNTPSVTVGDLVAGADDVGALNIGVHELYNLRAIASGSVGSHRLTWTFTQTSGLSPIPIVPPLQPQAPCTPQSEVSGGGKGASGCNNGGVGWVSGYAGPYGTIPEHDDPEDGETLTGKNYQGIEVWTDLIHTSYPEASPATTSYLRAQVPLADDADYEGGYKADSLLAVGDIENALGNEQGGPEAASADVRYTCALDATFAVLLDDQDFEGDEIFVKMASDAGRAAGTPPRILLRGIVERARYSTDRVFSVSAVDKLFSDFGPFGPDRLFPTWRFSDLGSAITAPADVLERVIPVLYGEKSDEGATDPITDEPRSKGLLPGFFLGRFTGITGATTEQTWAIDSDIFPTLDPTIQQSFAQQRDLAGGTFTGLVTSVIIPVVGGLSGPISPPTSSTYTTYDHAVSVFFDEVPAADYYIVIVFDGPYAPDFFNNNIFGSTHIRYKIHDSTTFDGQWVNGEDVAAFRTDFQGWDDGDNVLEIVTTSTEDEWGFLAFGLGPWFRVFNVYGSNFGQPDPNVAPDPSITRDRAVLDLMTRSDIMVPGYIWPFEENVVRFTNDQGQDFDIFGVYVKGPLLDDHVNGVVNITMNAIGTPDVADGSGLPLIKAHHCEHHWLENHVINRWRTGAFTDDVTFPQYEDGTPMVRSSDFIECQDFTVEQLGGNGLTVGWHMDEPKSNLQCVHDWMRQTNTKTGTNAHGQIVKWWLDESVATTGWDRIVHEADAFGPIEVVTGEDRQNVLRAFYDWDPDKEKFRAGPIQEIGEPGIEKYKNRRKPGDDIEATILNVEADVTWVLERTILRLQHGVRLIEVRGPLAWLDRDVGDGVLLTSELGVGAGGWVDHPFVIMRRRYALATRSVSYSLLDVRDLLD